MNYWYRHCKETALSVLEQSARDSLADFHYFLACGNPADMESREPKDPSVRLLADQLCKSWPVEQQNKVRPMILAFLVGMEVPMDKGRYICAVQYGDRDDIAWVPKTSQAGDQMCIIGGAPAPFILRPCVDGTFKLLGDAYSATGTLKEALGGKDGYSGMRPPSYDGSMNWDTDDRETLGLMDNMGWITLS